MPPETQAAESGEPPFVVPHHMSDIDHWKHPERNFYIFICLSFLLGFIGADHFYLRSFGTAIQKLIFNIFTFGLWYFWDVIQIASDSKRVREEGLTSPFDWIRGIGRGVFIDPVKKAEDEKDANAKVVRVKKDLVVYALLTIFTGAVGLDRLYLGAPMQGITKLISSWNFFTFLFGWMWIMYDIFVVIFYPDSVVKGSIGAPMPFNFLFPTGISGEQLFMPELVSKEELAKEAAESSKKGFFEKIGFDFSGGWMPGLPNIFNLETFRFFYRELAVPLLQPTVGTAVRKVDQGVSITEKAVAVGTEVGSAVPKVAGAVGTQVAALANPATLVDKIQAAAAAKAGLAQAGGSLLGGGNTDDNTSGPIIAGTLTAIVLAGAVKVVAELLSDK